MLTNPVLVSVIIMTILCLLKVNILLAIIASGLVAGLIAGIPLIPSGDGESIMSLLVGGMGGQANTALSYILLGALAVGIYQTGLASMLSQSMERLFGKQSKLFLLILAGISCFSQNLIPIHIAFIPIVIPPLLNMMNDMKLDRRSAACALTFGLKAPYITLPVGFGLIFHGVIIENIRINGMEVSDSIWPYMILPGISMVFGLLVAIFFSYRKPRTYENKPIALSSGEEGAMVSDRFTIQHLGAILGAVSAFVLQLVTDSLPLGAFVGLVIMIVFGAIPFKSMDHTIGDGVKLMGFIAFVMLVAAGYGNILRETNGVDALVQASVGLVGGSKVIAAIVMLLLGLLITMGIGTSFGTIPIVATIYVPFCTALGFSGAATAILIGVAGALGDAGSPASDSTLGPTSGLNADGQHDHIWDTCVPTFLHYNIPLLIVGFIAAMIY